MFERPGTGLTQYIRTVRSIPKLSRTAELELATEWTKNRNRQAADQLLSAHLRYVVAIVIGFKRYQVPLEDLVAEGNLGLLQAIEKFEPSRGFRFVTYATFWIRARMVEAVLRNWSIVRGGSPALRSKSFFRLRRERARLTGLLGEGPEARAALAKSMKLKPDQLDEMLARIDGTDVSLDAPLHIDGSATLVGTLPSTASSQEEVFERRQRHELDRELVEVTMRELDPRERLIIESRVMADPDDARSLSDLGAEMGISRERVRQLESRATANLSRAAKKIVARRRSTRRSGVFAVPQGPSQVQARSVAG